MGQWLFWWTISPEDINRQYLCLKIDKYENTNGKSLSSICNYMSIFVILFKPFVCPIFQLLVYLMTVCIEAYRVLLIR